MIAVPAGSVTYEHVGRTDQSGFVILYVHSLPLHWRGASLTVRSPSGAEQVWDLTGTDTLWLREDTCTWVTGGDTWQRPCTAPATHGSLCARHATEEARSNPPLPPPAMRAVREPWRYVPPHPPARWLQIAETIAEEVTE